jgi:hypothetical protein
MDDTRIRRKREIDRKAQNTLRQRQRAHAENLELQVLVARCTATLNEERLLREIHVLTGRNRDLLRRLQEVAHVEQDSLSQSVSGMNNFTSRKLFLPLHPLH